jgi:hypothetical protein
MTPAERVQRRSVEDGQPPRSDVPSAPLDQEPLLPQEVWWKDLSTVRLLLVTLVATCTAIYLVVTWRNTDDRCASTYPYTAECTFGEVMGAYVLE